MSYFNHAFAKMFIGTKGDQADNPGTSAELSEGFLMEAGIHTGALIDSGAPYSLGVGTFGFFDKETWLSVDVAGIAANNCCPLVLASSSLLAHDKVGPFHGGYQESNKSKYIVPNMISKFYKVEPCTAQAAIIHVGNTNYAGGTAVQAVTITAGGTVYPTDGVFVGVPLTGGTGSGAVATVTIVGGIVTDINVTDGGVGYAVSDVLNPDPAFPAFGGAPATDADITVDSIGLIECCAEFYCGESYNLLIEVKGSPVLRFANHHLYRTASADGGCCDGPVPTIIDSTLIFIQWGNFIVEDAYLKDFISPIVFDESGAAWYAPGTVGAPQTWDDYVSTGHTAGACAGIRLQGAYVETKFGNCSFETTDHYEVEPLRISASLTDLTGDPCVFEGICVLVECEGLQVMGLGETIVRDLILAESYLTNTFNNDKRLREINQGDQILGTINRNSLYTKYYIQHTVPRNYNPSSQYDNDQYLLEVVTNVASAGFEAFMDAWLDNCTDCTQLVTYDCTPCVPTAIP